MASDERAFLEVDPEGLEMTIWVFSSLRAREKVARQFEDSPEFTAYADSFTCTACAVMKDQDDPAYLPPYPGI